MSTGVLISKSEQIGKDCSTSLHSRYSSKLLKISRFQNEFMKSSFLPTKTCQDFCPVEWYSTQAEIPKIFCSYFGRNYDFIDSF